MSSPLLPPLEEPFTASTILSKKLSDRVPAEIWRRIAALTIDRYHILLIEKPIRDASSDPLYEVNLDTNHVQDMLNTCLVSKLFKEGVKSGIRNHFSGHLYFWFGNFRPELCAFIQTTMAPCIKKIHIHIHSTETSDLQAFRAEWSHFIRSRGFSDLQEVRVFAPYTVKYDEYEDFLEGELRVLDEVARIKRVVAAAGLNAAIPCSFRISAYAREEDLPAMDLGIDPSQIIGLTGRAITDKWRRKCDMPISYRQLRWLWSVEANPAPT